MRTQRSVRPPTRRSLQHSSMLQGPRSTRRRSRSFRSAAPRRRAAALARPRMRSLARSPAMVIASVIAPQVAITSTRHEVPFVDDVREAQFGLKAPRMVTVDARGFHLPDGFHLSTYAQCKLGKEMAEVFASSFPPADPQQEMYAPSVDDMTLKEDNGSCAKEPKQSG
mmetsp:Transcript_28003/g.66514  ORF Transcript_28003/g.66514 Transcript_28003/m.66514 type:complete len:168 (-) Transcript_28003:100-603(-)